MSTKVNTPKFRVNWPHLFRPEPPIKGQAQDPNKKPTYSITMLFEKGQDLSILYNLAQEACKEEWGADKTKWPKPFRSPFRDQAERAEKNEGYIPGAIFVKAKAYVKPGLVDSNLQDILEEKDFYSGCYARASVTAYPYRLPTPGVSFWIGNVQKLADGEPLGGRTKPADDFEPVTNDSGTGEGTTTDSIFG